MALELPKKEEAVNPEYSQNDWHCDTSGFKSKLQCYTAEVSTSVDKRDIDE